MSQEARAAHFIHALRHFSEQYVVADVVVSWQTAAGHTKLADLLARKYVIGFDIGVLHNEIAVHHHEIGLFPLDPRRNLPPVVVMMLMTRAKMQVGNLHYPIFAHIAAMLRATWLTRKPAKMRSGSLQCEMGHKSTAKKLAGAMDDALPLL
jgi:hypothetical protein